MIVPYETDPITVSDAPVKGHTLGGETGMSVQELVAELRKLIPKPVDYAEMVGAPAWAYGCKFGYEDPVWYLVDDAIDRLLEQEKELSILKKETIT